jgi:hypothetical protein
MSIVTTLYLLIIDLLHILKLIIIDPLHFLVSIFKNKSSIDNLRKFYEGKIVLVTGMTIFIILYYIIIIIIRR